MSTASPQSMPERGFDSLARTSTRTSETNAKPTLTAVAPLIEIPATRSEPSDSVGPAVNLASSQNSDTDHITPPQPQFVQSLAVVIFEIIEGVRSIQQLGGSVTLRANRQIAGYRAARLEQRTVLRIQANSVRHVGSVRIDRPTATVAEAAAVIYIGERARAVAVRLQWQHSRWRADDVSVL